MILTGFMVALRAFFVANSIPFFKDVVVALIGAFTSVVPLIILGYTDMVPYKGKFGVLCVDTYYSHFYS
jgi:hypothetical protein